MRGYGWIVDRQLICSQHHNVNHGVSTHSLCISQRPTAIGRVDGRFARTPEQSDIKMIDRRSGTFAHASSTRTKETNSAPESGVERADRKKVRRPLMSFEPTFADVAST